MSKVFITLVILFVGLGTVLIVQAMQTTTASVYTPSELAKLPTNTTLARVRVAGQIAAEELHYQIEPSISLSFRIRDPEGEASEALKVEYDKLMPDMFAPGRSVIIDGEFRGGVLRASSLMTQCPSKYEPPAPSMP